jgi:hypothetical protein
MLCGEQVCHSGGYCLLNRYSHAGSGRGRVLTGQPINKRNSNALVFFETSRPRCQLVECDRIPMPTVVATRQEERSEAIEASLAPRDVSTSIRQSTSSFYRLMSSWVLCMTSSSALARKNASALLR